MAANSAATLKAITAFMECPGEMLPLSLLFT
jgi:hypothetical protein